MTQKIECAFMIFALALFGGCRGAREGADSGAGVLREDMSWGPVGMEIQCEPARISLKSDAVLTIRVTAPEGVEVSLPPLDDRVEGFVVGGIFDEEPSGGPGDTTLVRYVRLTPVLAEEYRLKPFAVRYVDRRETPARTDWFPTRPIVFQTASLVKGIPGGDIEAKMEPVWIYPPFRTVAAWAIALLATVVLVFVVVKLAGRIRRHVELMRLSPRERALRELDELQSKRLVEQDKVKDFYLELTMIVRRYIERQHSLRAPEQTTEEFLAAAAKHPRFAGRVVERLKAFLEAADLVKFAAYHPVPSAIDKAVETAKDYIETDSPII